MIKEDLLEDLKKAMKEKNEIRKNTVQMVRAAILQVEKDKKENRHHKSMGVPRRKIAHLNV